MRAKSLGYERMAESSVFICGLARDIDYRLERLIPKIEQLGRSFKDYGIFIYENDSKDRTKEIIKQWGISNSKVSFLSENLNAERLTDLSPQRIKLAASYRNKYMNYIRQNFYKHHNEYTIVIDLDIYNFLIDGIADSIGHDNWDCIASNGRCSISLIKSDNVYYDAFAHEDDEERKIRSSGRLMDSFRNIQQRYSPLQVGDQLVPVDSAFNGLALYKTRSILNCNYGVIPGYAEHPFFHREMSRQGKDNIFINPSQLVMYDKRVFKKYLPFFEKDGLTEEENSVE